MIKIPLLLTALLKAMPVKHIRLLCIFLLLPVMAVAEEMSVESFRKLDTDMSARITFPEKDPSGRTCAIIKVVNPNTGFVFDTGTVSVVKTRQETGEIWVYVQPGVKKLTVSHQTLGVMRDYYFPMAIEEATVYELRLATGTVHTYVEQRSTTAYLVVSSEPSGADVYISGEWVGNTPFQKKYNQGERLQYRVSRALYHDEVGEVVLDKTKNEIVANLRPAFGSISVTSEPAGATVMLDNETQPRGKTPITIDGIASGSHRVRVQLPRYGQQVIDVAVADGSTARADARLAASFASVTVHTLPGATIKADGATKGTGTATWEQDAGLCDIEVSLEGHRKQSRQIEVAAGQPQTLRLDPVPMYGIVAVESDPIGADIYIDGEKRGVTPDVFDQLLAKDHAIRLSKAGCADYSTTITVREGEEQTVEAKLSTGELLTISTGQPGDDVYVDGKFVGQSPFAATMPYGRHTAYAMRGGKRSGEKTIDVSPGIPASIDLKFDGSVEYFDGSVEYTVKGVSFRMIPVEGGTFTMGATGSLAKDADNDETPTHQVTLSDYMIGETEVTQALWEAVMGTNPSYFTGSDRPVEKVSWNDCQTFIKKLNALTGMNFRLPTEAEWEYAAKGGKKAHGYLYSGSDNIGSVAWYDGNANSQTHPVATKAPNELGIYDMTGNVWEWCSDWKGSYTSSSQTNPTGSASGSYRVLRGGSWFTEPRRCRVSLRSLDNPGISSDRLGLRLSLVP